MALSEFVELQLLKERVNQAAWEAHQEMEAGIFGAHNYWVEVHNSTLKALRDRYDSVLYEVKMLDPLELSERGDEAPGKVEKIRGRETLIALRCLLKVVLSLQESLTGAPLPECLRAFEEKIGTFWRQHPFERNVFIMARDRANEQRLTVSDALRRRDLYPVWAADERIADDTYNAVACLWCCKHGVALFDEPQSLEDREEEEDEEQREDKYNANVMYELGMMHVLGRKCLILKSDKVDKLPTDVVQKLYEEYSEGNARTIQPLVLNWAQGLDLDDE